MLVIAGVAAACTNATGSSPTLPTTPTTSTSTTTTTTIVPVNAVDDFQACLADGGVVVAEVVLDAFGRPRLDLALDGVDLSDPGQAELVASCSALLSFGALDLSETPLLRAQVVSLLQDFSECVRSQGVATFPDPVPGFNGIGGPYPVAEIPYADPDLPTALATCRQRAAAGSS